MIAIGNFLFRYRNGLFPLVYGLLVFKSRPLISDYAVAVLIGVLVAGTGQLLRALTIGLEYIVRGGRDRRVYADHLVQGGVFAHCRNPLYVGNFLILLGLGLASNSVVFLSIAIPFFTFAYWAIIAAEENYLRNKFGAEFDDYCARVNRIVPDFSGFGQTIAGMHFNWRRLITAEYGSAYIWMAGITLVTLKNVWQTDSYQPGLPSVLTLCTLFFAITLSYALARFLKKTGRLKGRVPVDG
jgi:protein-S-isoprenylcysteine O-methyltransferase Ste14